MNYQTIVKNILVKHIYYCIQDILLHNEHYTSAMSYFDSEECREDCNALRIDYNKLLEWVTNPTYIPASVIPKRYKVSWQRVHNDITDETLPTIKRSYRGKKWHYITFENLIEYDRRS